VILCGGRGIRLGSLTDTVPKPMIEVNGKPFIYYLVTILSRMGVKDIVLSVGYLKEKFSTIPGVRLVDCHSEVNKSVLKVPCLKSLFILANGDVFPVIKWKQFLDTKVPRVAIKTNPIYKDAGIAIVDREDVRAGRVDCGSIGSMMEDYEPFGCSGNLHIGTPEGLKVAEERLKLWWKG
jgi:NDP-sugar pyrophosphorylase family protein